MDALKLISESSMKENVPQFNVGDTVKVHVQIKEGDKSRIQVFEGTVIAKKHGGINETFTVRRVAHGCGIERVFPLHSPVVEIEDEIVVAENLLKQEKEKIISEIEVSYKEEKIQLVGATKNLGESKNAGNVIQEGRG